MERQHRTTSSRGTAIVLLIAGLALTSACSSTRTTTTNAGAAAPATSKPTTTTSAAPATTSTVAPVASTTPLAPGALEVKVVDSAYGKALAKADGNVLYAWDDETGPDAACLAACTETWPPYVGTSIVAADGVDVSHFTLLPRPDGSMQLAVDGHRLYGMNIDTPGQVNCQAADGWYIRNPDGSSNRNEKPIASPR